MRPNSQISADLVTFTEEILNPILDAFTLFSNGGGGGGGKTYPLFKIFRTSPNEIKRGKLAKCSTPYTYPLPKIFRTSPNEIKRGKLPKCSTPYKTFQK